MERLTEYTELGDAITSTILRNNGHQRCVKQLAKYEDTGLTPEEVFKLKERHTAIKVDTSSTCQEHTHHKCPKCGSIKLTTYADGCRWGSKPKYCDECGQRLDWSE